METATIIKIGRSQAVRLPKAFQFGTPTVWIVKLGDVVMLIPPGKEWDLLENSLHHFTPDFMAHREQPKTPQRRKTV